MSRPLHTTDAMVILQTRTAQALPVQLRTVLRQEIDNGVYGESGKLPSERALAERFGVSRTSIRESLDGLVKDGLLMRVVGKGTFVASAAQAFDTAQTQSRASVAFLIGENIFHFVQPGYSRVLLGAEQMCRQLGHSLVFHSVGEDENFEQHWERNKAMDVGGYLVAGGLRKKTLDLLLNREIPVVLTDLIVQDENATAVGPDYGSGTRQALEHLAGLGHRQIGFIGFPNSEKYRAYWQTLDALDLRYRPQFVHFLHLPDVPPGILAGFQAMQAIIQSGNVPTALVVTNDLVAVGVMESLKLARIAVPESVSVVGYDDLGTGMAPPLTTIRSFPEEVGRVAARTLLANIAGDTTEQRIAIPTELVVRGTTAGPERKEGIV
ncbi:MAG TPA: GntR family transcriptional regulator [Bryobacteraceae bacterium]|nr:GntR family transcriptional regulator [Bryobacteraceae bacterium]